MALAQKMNGYDRTMEGNTARALPSIERDQRPAPRPAVRKQNRNVRRALVFSALGWAFAMACALVLIQRNTLMAAENSAIMKDKEAMVQLEAQNQELKTKLEQAVSVEEVERWAQTHGMQRPQVVKSLAGSPAVAAVQPEAPKPAAQAAPKAAQPKGFWSAVSSYFARVTGNTASAKK